MIRFVTCSLCTLLLAQTALLRAQESAPADRPPIMLPTSKMLTVPSPGRIGSTNSFPADDGAQSRRPLRRPAQRRLRHAGDAGAPVDRNPRSNQQQDRRISRRAPERRIAPELFHRPGLQYRTASISTHRSVRSPIPPARRRATRETASRSTVCAGKVTPERFIPIPLQPLSTGKKLAVGLTAPPHTAIPYPAGIALISDSGHDKLLIANNLSDNAIVLDPATGKVLQTFRSEHQRSDPVLIPVHLRCHARRAAAPGAVYGTRRKWRSLT